MNFNSYYFFLFLGVVLLLYRLLPWKGGRWVLLLASYYFYGNANPLYCILLLVSTLTDFWVAQKIEGTEDEKQRKRFLLLSVFVNVGLLSFFKYGDFFINNANTALSFYNNYSIANLDLILPVGISFYTFQTLSYTIDVYRRKAKANKDLIHFSLFVAYFPQLVAGPIERAGQLLPQLEDKKKVSKEDFMHGVERILWGLVKKTVFADRLAVFINEVYANPAEMPAPVLLAVMVGFMFQLYLDFSAYSDIAIGIARLMGVKLTENFNYPFMARNPADFWSRWHITLTRWFMDYVYKPMGGLMPKKPIRSALNTVFLLTLIGFWHGAAWNFVMFGFVASLTSLAYQLLRLKLSRKRTGSLLGKEKWSWPVGFFVNSLFLYPVGVFFRSPEMGTVWDVFRGVLQNSWEIPSYYYTYFALLVFLVITHVIRGFYMPDIRKGNLTLNYPKVLAVFLLILVLTFGAYEYKETFIYFQF